MAGISKEERERRLAAAKEQDCAIDDKLGNASFGNELNGLDDPDDPMNQFLGSEDYPGAGETKGPETVSRAEYEALQAQLAEMKSLLKSASAERPKVTKFDYQNASWLMNQDGVKFPATPHLREYAGKFKLVPCDPPADYVAAKGG